MNEAAREIIDLLGLEPLDIEGGWYRDDCQIYLARNVRDRGVGFHCHY